MNFEYYMNREYAYSRDKGKCKCCGNAFSPMLQKNCHHVKNKLPLDRINKVPNLVDGFREEIIVDAEVQLVIRFVVDFVIAKRYVADR